MKTILSFALFFSILTGVKSQHIQRYDCSDLSSLNTSLDQKATTINFSNETERDVYVYWWNGEKETLYQTLGPDQSYTQRTYTHHYWVIRHSSKACLGVYTSKSESLQTVRISKDNRPAKEAPILIRPDRNVPAGIRTYGCERIGLWNNRQEQLPTTIRFLNRTEETVNIYWWNGMQEKLYLSLNKGQSADQGTSTNHYWVARGIRGNCLGTYASSVTEKRTVTITGDNKPRFSDEQLSRAPYHGTIFLDNDILTEADPTKFQSIQYIGTGKRRVADRRLPGQWGEVNCYLFEVNYADGKTVEGRVNMEFANVSVAEKHARFYAEAIGRLPKLLLKDYASFIIHKGQKLFGGGSDHFLIHIGQGKAYIADGILEETLFHEATHVSIDKYYRMDRGWLEAQEKDGAFISSYAAENPIREDLAETLLLFYALKYQPGRLDQKIQATVIETIPNRIQYLESLGWNWRE